MLNEPKLIEPLKEKIRQDARRVGFVFDEEDVMCVEDGGKDVVFLRRNKTKEPIYLYDENGDVTETQKDESGDEVLEWKYHDLAYFQYLNSLGVRYQPRFVILCPFLFYIVDKGSVKRADNWILGT